MPTTQINGATQIQANSVGSGQVASSILIAAGTNALTGNLSAGSNKITSLATPTSGTDAATKGYVDGLVQGVSAKYSADAGTNTETLTIASGAVTQITGTTVNGVSPSVNDYVWIGNAPASTGAAGGSALSNQAANGLYQVTNNTTNLTVTRASDFSSGNPAGAYVFVAGGAQWGGGGFLVTSPSVAGGAFTWGTTTLQFTQFTGAGEITVDSTLTKTGNQLSRPALTGDVTASTGSNATTIAAAAVTLSKMANLAANSVIGNTTGSGATPAAVTLAAAATASSVALRDANANLTANALIAASQTIATAAGTTTLTVSSPSLTQLTGTTTQTVVMPNATTLANGQSFTVTNRSTGVVTVNMNGGSLLQTMAASSQLKATVISNGTSAGTWDADYSITNAGAGGGTVTTVSVASTNGFAGTVATATTTPVITISTSITGLVKGNGTAISAATSGTDYLAPGSVFSGATSIAGYVVREAPSGTKNGSNTTFTLASTPISGSEMLFLNGVLQESGGGSFDYGITSGTITMTVAPLATDVLYCSYWH